MALAWTVEQVEQLRALYARGDSASVIAAAIGGGASRNAVIGKIHRLGLEPRGRRVVEPAEQKRKQQEAQIRHTNAQRIRRAAERGERPPVLLQIAPPLPPFEGSFHLEIHELRPFSEVFENQCRFPEGEAPAVFYCGNVTLPGDSYCGHCREKAYQPRDRQATKKSVRSSEAA